MAQYHNIKSLKEVEGLSERRIAKKLGISRNTVSKYLNQSAQPLPTAINRQRIYGCTIDHISASSKGSVFGKMGNVIMLNPF